MQSTNLNTQAHYVKTVSSEQVSQTGEVLPNGATTAPPAESRAPETHSLLSEPAPHSTHPHVWISRHAPAEASPHASLHASAWWEAGHEHHGHVLSIDAPERSAKHRAVGGLLLLAK